MVVSFKYVEEKLRKFLIKEYGIELEVPVRINKRLKNVYGQVNIFDCPNGSMFIESVEFHPGILKTNRYDRINNLIKHETIHYALIKKGGEFRDDDVEFKQELKKHNVGSCDLELNHNIHIYICQKCDEVVDFKMRKINQIICNNCGNIVKSDKVYSNYKEVKKDINKLLG